MTELVLDAGALMAVERGDQRMRALLETALARGYSFTVSAVVIAQVWRGGRGRQALLARFLTSDRIDERVIDSETARAIGILLHVASAADVVDAHVALLARQVSAKVVTSDPEDIGRFNVPVIPI